ncbi:ArsA family ATPase [Streptomyces sp. LP05-1]|uniref:ArsA family ATPase n=1 Tax=Streptomyces pyxinae TaxID=2970734 RepID=A0ABT2CG07_9ACTN|nr:ArsA-related P-loop ATPase [Streptomyces sp. LP05-1]MCS0636357.1 ArsA family ATPase [Streptomyces sp. LP05-1]
MRILLFTGPGGAGRTTVAAATAWAAARHGRRVLLLTGDPADRVPWSRDGAPDHPGSGPAAGPGKREDPGNPGDPGAPGSPESPEDRPGAPVVRHVDSAAHFRAELLALQERAAVALDLLGAAPLADEELTEPPGADRFALLRALREAAAGDWELVVVDLPPVHEALALLALPEQLRRYLRRLLPAERQAARALRPVLAQLVGVPMPAEWLYRTAARWDEELAAAQEVLDAPGTTVRLVAEPGPAATDALRTARAGLALLGRGPELVVANRLLPTTSMDPWFAGLAAQQQSHLKSLYEDFGAGATDASAGVVELPHLGRDPRTPEDLVPLAPPVDALPPAAPPGAGPGWRVEDRRDPDGILVWHLPLPGAVKSELGLVRRGDELVLSVGPFRRIVPLPSALRRCTVSGARLADGVLSVRFTPDPGLWPKTPRTT